MRDVRAEVDRIARPEVDDLAVDGEAHPPLEHVDELLARVAHRLAAAGRQRVDDGLRAGKAELAVAAGDVLEREARLRRVDPGALAGADDARRAPLALLVDEVADGP